MPQQPEIALATKFEHPEGLVWHAQRGRLLWVDIFKGQVLTFDPVSGSLKTLSVGQLVGSVAPRRGGGLVCAVREGFGILSEEGAFSSISEQLRGKPHLQMNDGGVDPQGRFWAGSMSFEYATNPGTGALYSLDARHRVSEQLSGVSVGNGIGWSPDSKICYFVDSATRRIDRYEFDLNSGTLGKRSTLAEVDALPDGLAVDVDGAVWVAMFQGWEVRRFTPAGRLDRVLRMPGSQVTTCAFGGADLRTLYIAVSPYGMAKEALKEQTAGYIFAADVGVQGMPAHEFSG